MLFNYSGEQVRGASQNECYSTVERVDVYRFCLRGEEVLPAENTVGVRKRVLSEREKKSHVQVVIGGFVTVLMTFIRFDEEVVETDVQMLRS